VEDRSTMEYIGGPRDGAKTTFLLNSITQPWCYLKWATLNLIGL
jgi:hypothetical protein